MREFGCPSSTTHRRKTLTKALVLLQTLLVGAVGVLVLRQLLGACSRSSSTEPIRTTWSSSSNDAAIIMNEPAAAAPPPLPSLLLLGNNTNHNHTNKTETTDTHPEQERILIFSFVYGQRAAHKKYLRLFCESARYATNVDFVILGDLQPPHFDFSAASSNNVQHVLVSWDDLIDRVEDKVFGRRNVGDLRNASGYKVNDFKPLFGYLFPDLTKGYDWWGHMDNDVIVGNLRQFLTDKVLRQSDIITGLPGVPQTGHYYTYGAFTLYRNTQTVNELFRLSALPLESILGNRHAMCFDEWGECGGGQHDGVPKNHVNASMSGIIFRHAENLGLRWRGRAVPFLQDHYCQKFAQYQGTENCAPCVFRQGTLVSAKPRGSPNQPYEVGFCHYQRGKKAIEESLLDESRLAQLAAAGEFQVSFDKGVSVLQQEN